MQSTNKKGEGGIRTRGSLVTNTDVPGLHLKPLGHFSNDGHENDNKKIYFCKSSITLSRSCLV